MSAAYVLPLWSIALIAPQYPEGLGMLIRINGIDGFKESDLQSINGLNHYIGMRTIEPGDIPELRFMPVILAVLIVAGLGVAAWGKRKPFIAWTVALAAVFAAGVADFWKWGYDYGHNLDPNAIIKIPGMTYQPPVIGSKQLLNFTATSWPASGGWILIAMTVVITVALVLTLRRRSFQPAIAAASLVVAAACAGTGPRPFVLHEDSCDFCRMTISDARYGGEVVTAKGRVHTFDSIECLVSFVRAAQPGALGRVYVIDLQHPGTFVDAGSASFLSGVLISGPMGKATVAFATATDAEAQRAMLGGTMTTWAELLETPASVKAGT